MLKYLLAISVLFCVLAPVLGQSPYFKNYKVREGLPSNNVYYVFQDSKGYIWLCTDVGVSKFDGARFTNFTTANGLTDNEVFSCLEDKDGRIWFATLNGKPSFYADGKMHSEKDTPFLSDFNLNGLVFNIHEEENGEIVFVSGTHIGNLDFKNKRYSITQLDNGAVQAWREKGRSVGMVSNRHIGYFKDERFTPLARLNNLIVPVKHVQVNDTLYLTYATQLIVWDLNQHTLIRQINLPKQFSESIAIAAIGNRLWIGDRRGVFLLDRKTLMLQQSYLHQSQVSAILEDAEGGWWFSTLENGIYYVPSPEFLTYNSTVAGKPLRVNCLSPDSKGQLWAGLADSQFGLLKGHDDWRIYQYYPPDLKPRAINSIRHFPDGTTLLAGKAGVLRFQGDNRSFFRFRSSDVNLDAAGNLWSGLTGLYFVPADKLNNYVLEGQKLDEASEPTQYSNNPPERLAEIRVSHILFDTDGSAWLASPNGLFHFMEGKLSPPILPYAMRELQFDAKEGLLLALSESNGLYRLRQGQVVDSIRIGSESANAICRDFCVDENGDFWLASANGLYKIEREAENMRLVDYTNFYGLGGESINAVAIHEGHVFMGKDDGFVAVPLSKFAQKPPPPPIYLKYIQVNKRIINDLTKLLKFNYNENAVTINFEGLSYKDFKKLQYRYRLIGYDEEWHTTNNEAVEYASLRPGHYQFEVIAVNSTGVHSKLPAVVDFQIAPPFWMRWWFVLLSISMAAGLVLFWVRRRERKLRRKYEMQRRLIESENERLELQKKNTDLKMLSLRLQMNPHFIFNALNTIKGYYGQDKLTQANSYITKFAKLLRLNLDYTDTFIPLEKELELLMIYLQLSQIRYPNKLEYSIELAPGIIPSALFIPSMTIQPFVENAVIHGIVGKDGQGMIELIFKMSDEKELLVIVRDNGIGREASAHKSKLRDPHKPLATAITAERLALLRKNNTQAALEIHDICDENGKVAGTEVRVRLPVDELRIEN